MSGEKQLRHRYHYEIRYDTYTELTFRLKLGKVQARERELISATYIVVDVCVLNVYPGTHFPLYVDTHDTHFRFNKSGNKFRREVLR